MTTSNEYSSSSSNTGTIIGAGVGLIAGLVVGFAGCSLMSSGKSVSHAQAGLATVNAMAVLDALAMKMMQATNHHILGNMFGKASTTLLPVTAANGPRYQPGKYYSQLQAKGPHGSMPPSPTLMPTVPVVPAKSVQVDNKEKSFHNRMLGLSMAGQNMKYMESFFGSYVGYLAYVAKQEQGSKAKKFQNLKSNITMEFGKSGTPPSGSGYSHNIGFGKVGAKFSLASAIDALGLKDTLSKFTPVNPKKTGKKSGKSVLTNGKAFAEDFIAGMKVAIKKLPHKARTTLVSVSPGEKSAGFTPKKSNLGKKEINFPVIMTRYTDAGGTNHADLKGTAQLHLAVLQAFQLMVQQAIFHGLGISDVTAKQAATDMFSKYKKNNEDRATTQKKFIIAVAAEMDKLYVAPDKRTDFSNLIMREFDQGLKSKFDSTTYINTKAGLAVGLSFPTSASQ